LIRLYNFAKRIILLQKKKVLAMVYALQKFKHYLLSTKLTFFVDHMVLMYLINKPQVFGKIARWILLFLKYDFKILYKHGRSHLMQNAFNRLLGLEERLRGIRAITST
jgi:hypothetical protein